MGYLKRRLVPRSVRRVAHPVRTATRAVTPQSIKTVKRATWKVAHPVAATKSAIEREVVDSVLGKPTRKPSSGAGSGSRRPDAFSAARPNADRVQAPASDPSPPRRARNKKIAWAVVAGALLVALVLTISLASSGHDAPPVVPHVVGERLDIARSEVEAAGYNVDVVGGGMFGVWVESHWTVCQQETTSGTPLGGTGIGTVTLVAC